MRSIHRIVVAILVSAVTAFIASSAAAQTLTGVEFVPVQPSSADTIILKIPRGCANSNYTNAGYRVSSAAGKIRVDIMLGPPPPCAFGAPPAPALLVDIGRLPPGAYSVDIVEARLFSFEVVFASIVTNLPFAVSDHRAAKTAPAVRLNYSDHWWDPNNPGTGLFIWQDALDQVLAAWFTYGADGKAAWYTIQAGAWVTSNRYEGKLVETSRLPSTVSPPLIDGNGPTNVQIVGTAALDFSGDDGANAGILTYTFANTAGTRTRNIRRFGK